jgi:hypothetical protein
VTLSFAVGPNAPSKTTDKVGGRLLKNENCKVQNANFPEKTLISHFSI